MKLQGKATVRPVPWGESCCQCLTGLQLHLKLEATFIKSAQSHCLHVCLDTPPANPGLNDSFQMFPVKLGATGAHFSLAFYPLAQGPVFLKAFFIS
jgi:hypothetical protein